MDPNSESRTKILVMQTMLNANDKGAMKAVRREPVCNPGREEEVILSELRASLGYMRQ